MEGGIAHHVVMSAAARPSSQVEIWPQLQNRLSDAWPLLFFVLLFLLGRWQACPRPQTRRLAAAGPAAVVVADQKTAEEKGGRGIRRYITCPPFPRLAHLRPSVFLCTGSQLMYR